MHSRETQPIGEDKCDAPAVYLRLNPRSSPGDAPPLI
jgi:hypothetical protein